MVSYLLQAAAVLSLIVDKKRMVSCLQDNVNRTKVEVAGLQQQEDMLMLRMDVLKDDQIARDQEIRAFDDFAETEYRRRMPDTLLLQEFIFQMQTKASLRLTDLPQDLDLAAEEAVCSSVLAAAEEASRPMLDWCNSLNQTIAELETLFHRFGDGNGGEAIGGTMP